MKWSGLVISVILSSMACAASPDVGDATSGASESSAAVATTTSGTTASSTTDDASTTTIASMGESTVGDESSSSSGGLSGPELCRAAVTEAECDAAGNQCNWRPAFRVIDVESCTLEPAPDLQCWETESSGCFDGVPLACAELDVHPRYREVDGEIQLLDFPCPLGPAVVESDLPFWEICHSEELEDQGPNPPVCACLCGG